MKATCAAFVLSRSQVHSFELSGSYSLVLKGCRLLEELQGLEQVKVSGSVLSSMLQVLMPRTTRRGSGLGEREGRGTKNIFSGKTIPFRIQRCFCLERRSLPRIKDKNF